MIQSRILLTAVVIIIVIWLQTKTTSSTASQELALTRRKTALLIIDVQNDFSQPPPNGSLSVPGGLEIIPKINHLRNNFPFDFVVFSQDWHRPGHPSFYSAHPDAKKSGIKLFEKIQIHGRDQVLWPDHCQWDSYGAQFHPDLDYRSGDFVVQKGNRDADSYSAFMDNDHEYPTPLHAELQWREITHIVIVGLALDFCVGNTALDAKELGYQVTVVLDLTRPVYREEGDAMVKQMQGKHVRVMQSVDQIM
ncbi:hypothetical protein HK100_003406 [Physocladia obscura]|uniref:nicotinamidase n=1 Tax=Physocladia obscura TaxID=109957 RepID=A0AAD5SUC1_9FUNG|nr:hypothetical protein HK100_003406 [Physocladia obscura]